MYISVFSNTFLTMHRLKIDDKNRELEPEWSSFQRKICTYQLSIVSTITTKKENISWFIENKIEWLVCDVFAIFFFFRILSSSRMKVISTHFFIPFRSCHTEFLFVLSSCGGGHEGYIPLIDFIVLCSTNNLRLDVASEYLVYSFIVFTLSKPFFIRKSKKNF